ncbi:cytochrome b [Vibrio viridaestus]|uniref:Cytochrome b n=1 Tax=Vibrio viridaestus TaxID=2487322 RepID=A0A3N9TGR6_9VIBR|nr:cytochrome bc complex cytochrome b subunit [Vibrio viridaestus]RQW62953.1 cytochrome bc complex cytochrome b subunit [Vibrio viridaestus]
MKFIRWLDQRLPILNTLRKHVTQYPIPKNINGWYVFGSLLMLCLVIQLLSGLWLAMYYQPSAEKAFDSVQYIMREVNFGWLIRYMHTTGASALFIAAYLHVFRSMIYGSYQRPRELVWLLGMCLMILLMAEAFLGYLLPWGQMSYWGAKVILSLFEAIPFVGDPLATWVRGDYLISGVTLNRFYALHIIGIPLILLGLVGLHLLSLHHVGSNNPDGIDTKKKKGVQEDVSSQFVFHDDYTKEYVFVDCVPFHPYGTVKDLVAICLFLLCFCFVLFFNPTGSGLFIEPANAFIADPLSTPEHIAPLWYFTPFYAILRAVPDKSTGIILMLLALLLLFILPWIDRGKVRSVRYRSIFHRNNLAIFAFSFLGLGVVGLLPLSFCTLWLSRAFTIGYFMYFILLAVYSRHEVTKELPERVKFK